jgi:hypothetical protein
MDRVVGMAALGNGNRAGRWPRVNGSSAELAGIVKSMGGRT